MATLTSTDFVLPCPVADGGLEVCVTRYCPSGSTVHSKSKPLSLLFLHGSTYHKETWIPTIEGIFESQNAVLNDDYTIVEAWAIDAPNHGRSAILNDARLLRRGKGMSAREIARSIQVFLRSGLHEGRPLIGIAHSASVAVISLSTLGYAVDSLPFSSLILVDSPIMTREVYARAAKHGEPWNILIEFAKSRKNKWRSREAAREWMADQPPWATWNPRCLDLFVEYALRDLPTGAYPESAGGVTLCCTRVEEASCYVHHEDGFNSIDRLKDLCAAIPVHCIFGEREDMNPAFVKKAFVDASQGMKMASITTVADAGHLVVTENPQGLALAILGAIHQDWGRGLERKTMHHL